MKPDYRGAAEELGARVVELQARIRELEDALRDCVHHIEIFANPDDEIAQLLIRKAKELLDKK